MIFKFVGPPLKDGSICLQGIEAPTMEEAIVKFNKMYPEYDYNKQVERRYANARKVDTNN